VVDPLEVIIPLKGELCSPLPEWPYVIVPETIPFINAPENVKVVVTVTYPPVGVGPVELVS